VHGVGTEDRSFAVARFAAGPRNLGNVALGVLFAAVLLLMAVQYAGQGRPWVFDSAVGGVVCAVALGRRRSPGWAAVIGLTVATAAAPLAPVLHLPGEPGAAALLALLVLAAAAIRTLPWRPAVALAAAGAGLMGTGLTVVGLAATQASSTPFRVGLQAWTLGLGVGLALRLLDYRRSTTAESVRRDERLELARELHDVVAHHITGIVVQAQAARIVGRRDPERLDDALAGIEAAGAEALTAMRRVVGLLRDTDDAATTYSLGPTGPEQLRALVSRFEGHGPRVRLDLPGGQAAWPPEVGSTVFRVVQESLTNIARHAPHARTASVEVEAVPADRPDSVTVRITDDAANAHTPRLPRGGFGLVGMRERVEALGGSLSAGPEPRGGWCVTARIPFSARETW